MMTISDSNQSLVSSGSFTPLPREFLSNNPENNAQTYKIWRYSTWSRKTKWIVAIVGLIIFFGAVTPSDEQQKSLVYPMATIQPNNFTLVTSTPTLKPTFEPTILPTNIPTHIYLPTQKPTRLPTAVQIQPLVNQQEVCAGATALCGDGTCSYAANHRGACSSHKGVAKWYR